MQYTSPDAHHANEDVNEEDSSTPTDSRLLGNNVQHYRYYCGRRWIWDKRETVPLRSWIQRARDNA